ncbi:MAG TPA: toxin-antitoxin system YwqK family antitoxin [Rhodothermales bacterium]|nr:toxin-antitoxin system YwqK family antitoxin [Rhodothermales bacterium]
MTTLRKVLYTLSLCLTFSLVLAAGVQAQVAQADLEQREGLWYDKDSETPYTGLVAEPDRMEGRMEAGKRVGEWVWYYPSGQREFLMVYDDEGQRVRAEGWHPNGNKDSERRFKDGQVDGVMRHWDHNGVLRQEHHFKAGQPHGKDTLWDHNGALLYTATYVEGKLDGPAIWWYTDGQKRWETLYAMGERTGTWAQYAPDGDLLMQSEWKDGSLVSRHNPHGNH